MVITASAALQVFKVVNQMLKREVTPGFPLTLPVSPPVFGDSKGGIEQRCTLCVAEKLDADEIGDIGRVEITHPDAELADVRWVVLSGESRRQPHRHV